MEKRKAGLGRGLNALLNNLSHITTEKAESPTSTLKYLDIERIQTGQYQPRTQLDDDALDELAQSIKQQGLLQPIIVRPFSENKYEIVAGERRWRAALKAGLDRVPAVVQEISDETALAVALVENIQREDLNPIDQAKGLQRLMDEFNLTQQKVAEVVGKSRTAVTNLLRLMNLDDGVKDLLQQGDLDMGHARALLTLPHSKQIALARIIVKKQLSVRATERLVQQIQSKQVISKSPREVDPNISHLQNQLGERLCAKVDVQHANNGKGKLVIYYHSLDELEGIIDHIL
jgi:ParB family transcriptional regulator, chromosome partitioning protein